MEATLRSRPVVAVAAVVSEATAAAGESAAAAAAGSKAPVVAAPQTVPEAAAESLDPAEPRWGASPAGVAVDSRGTVARRWIHWAVAVVAAPRLVPMAETARPVCVATAGGAKVAAAATCHTSPSPVRPRSAAAVGVVARRRRWKAEMALTPAGVAAVVAA